ncbi:methyltransferase domain-containing protein [Candidatus Woesearchaeota archaeon]|nr:methyltransferase domain-containing protein [Candidatus Woesearchaeota archaeon]
MKQSLIPYLVCITCQSSLRCRVFQYEEEEIIEGKLTCTHCAVDYPIVKGIPRFVPVSLEKIKQKTAERFSYQWHKYSDIPKIFEQQFLDWIDPVKPSFFKNKIVLDAGCGMGRHLLFSSQYHAKTVIGVDLGDSVDVAYANTKHLPNVHIVQADLYHLPFNRIFNYIYSIGVLHHLPDPKQGFLSLAQHLRKKGTISIWVYGKENNFLLRFFNPLRKFVFSRLPLPFLHLLSLAGMLFLYPFLMLGYRSPLHKIMPHSAFFSYLTQFHFRHIRTIFFDQMLAPVAYYLTYSDVSDWLSSCQLRNPLITARNENSWRAMGIML